jgi:hypothetical protein
MPAAEMLTSARVVRAKLTAAARNVAEALHRAVTRPPRDVELRLRP